MAARELGPYQSNQGVCCMSVFKTASSDSLSREQGFLSNFRDMQADFGIHCPNMLQRHHFVCCGPYIKSNFTVDTWRN